MEHTNIDFTQTTSADVVELIKGTLSGNNQTIKESTRILKAYTKHKVSIRVLSYLLISSTQWQVRQMSTVLLKRNLINLYGNLDQSEQGQFRGVLLNQYIKQDKLAVQKGIATLIAILLPIIQLSKWPQLQMLLDQALKSAPQSPATFVLLNSLLYHFKPPAELYTYLLNAIQIPNLIQQSMKCLVTVVETQDVDQSIAVKLIQIWQKSNWTQDISLICFQVLNIMTQRKIKLGQEIIVWVCDKVISNKKLSRKFRTAGLDFLFTVSQYSSKMLANKQQLLKKIIETVCLACSQPHKHTQDQEDEGQIVQQIALWLIETLSISIKSKKIYPILLDASMNLINSQDTNKKNTGFLVLSAMAEGCADKVKKNLQNPIMNVLIPKGLSHQAPQVRGAAINTLCYFSQYLLPDIVYYHQTVIPSMLNYMNDLSTKVIQKALIAIDMFFDNMQQDQISSYLPIVVPKLNEVIIKHQSTVLMRKYSLSAIGSCITAAGKLFQPYVNDFFRTIMELLRLHPSPELNTVRAENIMALGKLSNCFCKSDYINNKLFFNTYIMPILEPLYNILTNDNDPQVRQACFSFFYLLANAIDNQFQPMFEKIIIQVLKGCQLKMPKQNKKQFSLDSDSQDDNQDYLPSTKATQYDQKAAAIHALGELAKACPIKFSPYFQQVYKILDQHYQFFYESIRIQVSNCYCNVTIGFIKSLNQGKLPQYTKGLPCIQRYPQKVQHFFKTQLIPKFIFMMSEDESSKAASVAIESFQDLLKQIGPVLVDRSLNPLKQTLIKLLENQDALESDPQDQQQQQQQQQDDTDAYIFEPVCDLIPALSQILKVGFEPCLHELYPYMLKFLEERQDINDNIQMVGCFSQCFKWIPTFIFAHHQELFRSICALVSLEDTDLNRNIAYSFAEMFQKSPQCMKVYLQDALIALKKIYEAPNSSEPCKDNALAALCRITYTLFPTMPYNAIVDSLIQRMPFKGDQQQQASAIKAIFFLQIKSPQLISQYRTQLLAIFTNDLQSPEKYHLTVQLIQQMKIYIQNNS